MGDTESNDLKVWEQDYSSTDCNEDRDSNLDSDPGTTNQPENNEDDEESYYDDEDEEEEENLEAKIEEEKETKNMSEIEL